MNEKHRVLIVDDTEEALVELRDLVVLLGDCEARAYVDPVAALVWVKESAYALDLVIVDYLMPGMNGIEFIQTLRQLPMCAEVPILMVATSQEKHVRYRALDSGANDILGKPIDRVEFLARARNMLSLSAARKQLADRATWLAAEVQKATVEIVARERETVFRLCKAAEYRDPETGAHILRMAHYSQLIAKGLGMSKEDQELLLEAAPMHDLGKVGIADGILLKAGRLDPAEFEIMKRHAEFGYELLQGSSSLVLQAGAEIARGHHEKFDGSGYPHGVKGKDIPIFSRIVAVADVFDALTSERPYKKAWELEEAVDFLLAGRGTHFDSDCVQAFLTSWEEVLDIHTRYQE
jgi:putative two-component system response regulator